MSSFGCQGHQVRLFHSALQLSIGLDRVLYQVTKTKCVVVQAAKRLRDLELRVVRLHVQVLCR